MRTRYNAPWIVSYSSDAADPGHRLLRDGCVVVEDDRIVHVGRGCPLEVDRTVDTTAVITPGFISTRSGTSSSRADWISAAFVARAGRTAIPPLRNTLIKSSASSTESSMKRILMTLSCFMPFRKAAC